MSMVLSSFQYGFDQLLLEIMLNILGYRYLNDRAGS